jgi:hypothetical protein
MIEGLRELRWYWLAILIAALLVLATGLACDPGGPAGEDRWPDPPSSGKVCRVLDGRTFGPGCEPGPTP